MGDFKLAGSSAPLFLAVDRGYYAEQGIEVDIQPGTGSGNTAKTVGAGTAVLGRVDGGVILQSIAQGIPIKTVAGLVQQSPMSVIFRKGAGIKAPKDLEGKKIVGVPGGSQESLYPAWMKHNNADPDKVQFISATSATRTTTFLQGTVDAAFGYIYSDVPTYEGQKVDVDSIMYADYGFNIPGLSFVANTGFMKEKPELVKGFVTATMKGFGDAAKDPNAAIDLFLKSPAGSTLTSELELTSLKLMIPLYHSKRTQGKPLGWMAPEDWQDAIQILTESGALSPAPKVEDSLTNDFVPSA
jgi:NitT/TauT family transport system substrate-binding protein